MMGQFDLQALHLILYETHVMLPHVLIPGFVLLFHFSQMRAHTREEMRRKIKTSKVRGKGREVRQCLLVFLSLLTKWISFVKEYNRVLQYGHFC